METTVSTKQKTAAKKRPKKRKTNLLVVATYILLGIPLLVGVGSALPTLLAGNSLAGFFELAEELGTPALAILTAMLAATPLNIVFGWKWPLPLKKPLGIFAFLYSAVHAFSYFGVNIMAEGGWPMVITGLIAVLIMLPLFLTSNQWSMKKLRRRWKTLHKLTYVVPFFVAGHLLFLGEGLGILMFIFLGMRLPFVRKFFVEWRMNRRRRKMQTAVMP